MGQSGLASWGRFNARESKEKTKISRCVAKERQPDGKVQQAKVAHKREITMSNPVEAVYSPGGNKVDTVQPIAKDGDIHHVRPIRNCKINNKAGEPDFEILDDTFAETVMLERRKRRMALLRSEKSIKVNDLVKFSKSFKLLTPIPPDLVGILAKDPAKQKAIVDSALLVASKYRNRSLSKRERDAGKHEWAWYFIEIQKPLIRKARKSVEEHE
jgi:hypothetical protein